jgi:hypothetical protein
VQESEIIGEDGQTPFVKHLGLCAKNETYPRDNVVVNHMGPPLEINGRMSADVVARADLLDDERRRIKVFIDRHVGEHLTEGLRQLNSYCIHPHAKDEPASDGTRIYTRFNCAGFALEAYHFAGIHPIDISAIPAIDLASLTRAYPIASRLTGPLRVMFGIDGDGPWPVLLPGYVIHALNRTPAQIRSERYRPSLTDADFS